MTTQSQQAKETHLRGQQSEINDFLFHESPIGCFQCTPDSGGTFLVVNPALTEMFGYANVDEFLVGSTRKLHAMPDDWSDVVEEVLSKGRVTKKEINYQKKDGSCFYGAVTAHLISDESGQAVFINAFIENVSEAKKDKQRLREEKSFLDNMIEGMPGLFWLIDESGHPVRWNKNVEALLGYGPGELRQMDVLKDLTTPETTQSLLNAANSAYQGGSGYCEYYNVTKSGKKIAFAGDARPVTINGKRYLVSVEIDITKRKQAEEKLQDAFVEIERLKSQLEADNNYLLDEIEQLSEYKNVIGKSKKFQNLLNSVRKVAHIPTTTLLLGETGTGKGVMAQLIHSLSPRHTRPLVKVNCANLPPTLIESILFGHEKGAFTNADTMSHGRFEIANGSSIFLDEIAELPLDLQSKLLRVIEEGEFERLGSNKTIRLDTRIIAATNRNLEAEVEAGRFRQDLFFRLNVYPITCPPLRQRIEDISLLAHHFVAKFNKSLGKTISKISNTTTQKLENYDWPGNIRELQNVIERAMINSSGQSLVLFDSFEPTRQTSHKAKKTSFTTLREVEINHILDTLKDTNWTIEGKNGAAKRLDLNASTLRARMRKYGIRRPGIVSQY